MSHVHWIYWYARHFFDRGGAKSANKRYSPGAPVSDEKIDKRLIGIWRATQYRSLQLNPYRAAYPELSAVGLGEKLYRDGREAGGNCLEMTCVTAYLFSEIAPWIPVHLLELRDPADHVFLLTGTPPATVLQPSNNQVVDRLEFLFGPTADNWAVDVWAGICCQIGEYPVAFWDKTAKWSRRGKQVRFDGMWINPSLMRYRRTHLTARFRLHSVTAPLPQHQ